VGCRLPSCLPSILFFCLSSSLCIFSILQAFGPERAGKEGEGGFHSQVLPFFRASFLMSPLPYTTCLYAHTYVSLFLRPPPPLVPALLCVALPVCRLSSLFAAMHLGFYVPQLARSRLSFHKRYICLRQATLQCPLVAHVAAVACVAPAGVSACPPPTRVPARPPSAGVPTVQHIIYYVLCVTAPSVRAPPYLPLHVVNAWAHL